MKDLFKLMLMLIIITMAASLTISGCGNVSEINGIDKIIDDDDDDDDDDNDLAFVTSGGVVAGGAAGAAGLLQGVFLDAAVQGVSYSGAGGSGTTTSSGTFNYSPGSRVTFSIGGIALGTASGKSTVTPIDVAGATDESDQRVINMLRLLQSLDDDGNANNGINITQATRTAAKNVTVDFNQAPSAFTASTATNVATLTATTTAGTSTLKTASEALTHFQSTLTANNMTTVSVPTTSLSVFDDFSSGSVSSSLWTISAPSGSSYSVTNGMLAVTTGSPSSEVQFAVTSGTLTTSINAFQADMYVSSSSGTSDDNLVAIEGNPYMSGSNDIWTQLSVAGDGSAGYSIKSGSTSVASGSFSSKTVGSSHDLAMGFDRTNGILYFQIDTEKLFHIMDTSTYPVSTTVWKSASAVVEAASGASAATVGNIDNVKAEALTGIFSSISHIGGSIQGLALATTASSVSTLAGSGSSGSSNNTGTAATFNSPTGITTDGTNLFVTDAENHLIRKVTSTTGVVTTLAGDGNSGTTNGTGTGAQFNNPTGITTDGINLYVSDSSNNMIRKVVISSGVVTTLAGSTSSGSTNATGTAASFYGPTALTIVGDSLYVADTLNHTIRKIVISSGVVTTLVGSGSAGSANGTGTAATFNQPTGITTDGTYLYVVDSGNDLIRKIVISSGVVTTLAGSGSQGSADGTGTAATFYNPTGITTDGTNLFVTDTYNNSIRKIVISSGVVTILAGSTTSGLDNSSGTSAKFYRPIGITTDGTNLFVADTYNHTIRKIQ
ncbi:MAG: hypothetical protein HQM14_16945 [SAR324 cluster bacterium]|nr:hypothetical protein [SAR324 cluster bacterium]